MQLIAGVRWVLECEISKAQCTNVFSQTLKRTWDCTYKIVVLTADFCFCCCYQTGPKCAVMYSTFTAKGCHLSAFPFPFHTCPLLPDSGRGPQGTKEGTVRANA